MASSPISNEPPKGSILSEVARGIESAMEKCIVEYGGLVWSIAQRYVRDRTAAEDVVQETFTDLWKSAKRYDPAIATECTFVGMLARRRAIDFARKQSRQPLLEPLPDSDSLDQPSTEASASKRCENEDIKKVLEQIPEETRNLFLLHFEQGMTHPEISEETGLPLGTVKTKLRRGLIEVRKLVSRLEGGAEPATQLSS